MFQPKMAMNFQTHLTKALIIAVFIVVWATARSEKYITTVKPLNEIRDFHPKHPRAGELSSLLPICWGKVNPPDVRPPNHQLRVEGPEVNKEDEINLVIITMPVYQDEKVDRQVLNECFEILAQLRSEAAFTSLEFHKEYILARTSRKFAPRFLGAFTGKFAYGVESGVENIVRKEWEHRTGG